MPLPPLHFIDELSPLPNGAPAAILRQEKSIPSFLSPLPLTPREAESLNSRSPLQTNKESNISSPRESIIEPTLSEYGPGVIPLPHAVAVGAIRRHVQTYGRLDIEPVEVAVRMRDVLGKDFDLVEAEKVAVQVLHVWKAKNGRSTPIQEINPCRRLYNEQLNTPDKSAISASSPLSQKKDDILNLYPISSPPKLQMASPVHPLSPISTSFHPSIHENSILSSPKRDVIPHVRMSEQGILSPPDRKSRTANIIDSYLLSLSRQPPRTIPRSPTPPTSLGPGPGGPAGRLRSSSLPATALRHYGSSREKSLPSTPPKQDPLTKLQSPSLDEYIGLGSNTEQSLLHQTAISALTQHLDSGGSLWNITPKQMAQHMLLMDDIGHITDEDILESERAAFRVLDAWRRKNSTTTTNTPPQQIKSPPTTLNINGPSTPKPIHSDALRPPSSISINNKVPHSSPSPYPKTPTSFEINEISKPSPRVPALGMRSVLAQSATDAIKRHISLMGNLDITARQVANMIRDPVVDPEQVERVASQVLDIWIKENPHLKSTGVAPPTPAPLPNTIQRSIPSWQQISPNKSTPQPPPPPPPTAAPTRVDDGKDLAKVAVEALKQHLAASGTGWGQVSKALANLQQNNSGTPASMANMEVPNSATVVRRPNSPVSAPQLTRRAVSMPSTVSNRYGTQVRAPPNPNQSHLQNMEPVTVGRIPSRIPLLEPAVDEYIGGLDQNGLTQAGIHTLKRHLANGGTLWDITPKVLASRMEETFGPKGMNMVEGERSAFRVLDAWRRKNPQPLTTTTTTQPTTGPSPPTLMETPTSRPNPTTPKPQEPPKEMLVVQVSRMSDNEPAYRHVTSQPMGNSRLGFHSVVDYGPIAQPNRNDPKTVPQTTTQTSRENVTSSVVPQQATTGTPTPPPKAPQNPSRFQYPYSLPGKDNTISDTQTIWKRKEQPQHTNETSNMDVTEILFNNFIEPTQDEYSIGFDAKGLTQKTVELVRNHVAKNGNLDIDIQKFAINISESFGGNVTEFIDAEYTISQVLSAWIRKNPHLSNTKSSNNTIQISRASPFETPILSSPPQPYQCKPTPCIPSPRMTASTFRSVNQHITQSNDKTIPSGDSSEKFQSPTKTTPIHLQSSITSSSKPNNPRTESITESYHPSASSRVFDIRVNSRASNLSPAPTTTRSIVSQSSQFHSGLDGTLVYGANSWSTSTPTMVATPSSQLPEEPSPEEYKLGFCSGMTKSAIDIVRRMAKKEGHLELDVDEIVSNMRDFTGKPVNTTEGKRIAVQVLETWKIHNTRLRYTPSTSSTYQHPSPTYKDPSHTAAGTSPTRSSVHISTVPSPVQSPSYQQAEQSNGYNTVTPPRSPTIAFSSNTTNSAMSITSPPTHITSPS